MNTTLAIAVWDDRVSTTFDFARNLLIVEADGGREISRREVPLGDEPLDKKARRIQDLSVQVKETHGWITSGKLRLPTLVVWGFNDPSALVEVRGLETMRLLFPNVPKVQMHILNQAGHPCYMEQPDAFIAAVTSFIKSVS